MYLVAAIVRTSRLAFGREIAQFRHLITIMAIVSLVLWCIVVITIMLRLWLCHVWYRRRYQTAPIELPPNQ